MERVRLSRDRHIAFAAPDGVQLFLDIIRPAEAVNSPMVLLVFGGGWCQGDRTTLAAAAHRLARMGFVTVSADYRLAPASPFPAALDDLTAALTWMHDHGEEYGGDPSRIGGYGVSAGGHLIGLLATAPTSPFTCAISWGGPMDMRQDPVTGPYRGYLLAFLAACMHENPQRYVAASPLCHLSPNTPPLLLIHGEADTVVPVSQSLLMKRRAVDVGASVDVEILIGAGHEPADPREATMAAAWEHIEAFLATHLRQQKVLAYG